MFAVSPETLDYKVAAYFHQGISGKVSQRSARERKQRLTARGIRQVPVEGAYFATVPTVRDSFAPWPYEVKTCPDSRILRSSLPRVRNAVLCACADPVIH